MPLFEPSKLPKIDIEPKLISLANGGVDRLRARLVDQIVMSPLPWLLIPAEVQAFFQGHVRRALMFIEGGYDAYLASRGLIVYTCARAIYETFAFVMDFCEKLEGHLADSDFEKIGAFVQANQFAARMEEFVERKVIVDEVIDNTVVNILTKIQRISKRVPEFLNEYEYLSERTHPNGLGALYYFWESGKDVIKFSNSVDHDHSILNLLKAGYLLGVMDITMATTERQLANHKWL